LSNSKCDCADTCAHCKRANGLRAIELGNNHYWQKRPNTVESLIEDQKKPAGLPIQIRTIRFLPRKAPFNRGHLNRPAHENDLGRNRSPLYTSPGALGQGIAL
jgi:hypothetical protein